MFGYVVPDKPNMLMKDYTLYRAYYCGLCRAIGQNAGQRFRMTINYDITFLAMLAENLAKECPAIKHRRCMVHVTGKLPMVEETEVFQRIVHLNTLIGYYKAADDVNDDKSAVKVAVRTLLKGERRRAAAKLPNLDAALKEHYARLAEYEQKGERDLDKIADPFATIMVKMGECFVKESEYNSENAKNFFRLCYNLGRWIYFIDALDDIDKDFKRNSFNPFLQGITEVTDEARERIFAVGAEALNGCLNEIKDAYDKMEITVAEGPLSNIVYLGLGNRQKEIIEKRGKYGKKSLLRTRSIAERNAK